MILECRNLKQLVRKKILLMDFLFCIDTSIKLDFFNINGVHNTFSLEPYIRFIIHPRRTIGRS